MRLVWLPSLLLFTATCADGPATSSVTRAQAVDPPVNVACGDVAGLVAAIRDASEAGARTPSCSRTPTTC